MPTRLFVATPTKLMTFADCKRKYRYTYLERPRPPKGPAWAHNTVGGIVHEVLADFFGRWPADRRTPDEVVARIRVGWRDEGFRDEAQSLDWRERATEMVLGYLRESDPYYEPRGVERTVAFTTSRASLRGRIDRIDERPARSGDGTELVIVDYKTGRRPLTSTDARSSLAMALYVLGARRVLHRPCTRVELHHLPTNTIAAADHDDASLARHQRRAESIADDAAAAESRWSEGLTPAEADEAFPPEPSPLCGWCDYAHLCPQGRRVAPPQPPWSGLEDLPPPEDRD
ncbi:RecB family exonuclease [Kribbella sp. NPDC056345]|uniref:RecB family exonuclease n=1 Tax=Kribbella sp. NPDC056345 TaxID=3345789 RepID=UPI0035E2F69C